MVVDVELWYFQLSEDQIPSKVKEAREVCYNEIKNIMVEQLILDLNNKCIYVGTLLLLLSLISETDYAITQISNIVVNKKLEEIIVIDSSISKDIILKNLFQEIFKVSIFTLKICIIFKVKKCLA